MAKFLPYRKSEIVNVTLTYQVSGAGAIAQMLRVFVTLSEDVGLVYNTHLVVHDNPVPEDTNHFFCSPWVPGTHAVYIHVCKQTIHTIHYSTIKKL